MRLLPGLELVASVFKLEFVEKVKAGIEFRCPEVVSRSLPEVRQRGLQSGTTTLSSGEAWRSRRSVLDEMGRATVSVSHRIVRIELDRLI